jgi:hypothetical protein
LVIGLSPFGVAGRGSHVHGMSAPSNDERRHLPDGSSTLGMAEIIAELE